MNLWTLPFNQPILLSVWDPPQKKRHAEICFIDKINSLNLDKTKRYEITCFITWSPCPFCAKELVAFIKDYPRLSLQIFASRLYFHWIWGYQVGLHRLWESNIRVSVMREPGRERGRAVIRWESLQCQEGRTPGGWGNDWTGRMVAQVRPKI